MIKLKKIFLTIFIFTALFSFIPAVWADTTPPPTDPGPTLELTYPIIPGEITPTTVNEGLPQYIKYIFSLAMALIGIVIFGVLIYNGFLWFTSAGNASKLKDAKDGITAAFLGSLILFSAFIIFRTINPQLTILTLTNPNAVKASIPAGIYLCDYDLDNVPQIVVKPENTLYNFFHDYTVYHFLTPDIKIDFWKYIKGVANGSQSGISINSISDFIKAYTGTNDEKQLEGIARAFIHIENNSAGHCFRVGASRAFPNFIFSSTDKKSNSAFQIPDMTPYIEENGKVSYRPNYEYGIVFHEKDNMSGKCKIYLYEDSGIDGLFHPNLGFNAYSSTLFKKPPIEPAAESKGAILYGCIDYNNASLCPGGVTHGAMGSLSTGGKNFETATTSDLMNFGLVTEKKDNNGTSTTHSEIRSIKIDPRGYYFAVLFDEDNSVKERCEVISEDDDNLTDNPIGRCGSTCSQVVNDNNTSIVERNAKCFPCAKSMVVIKGEVIK